ncbi:glycosyltransferase family 2 protein [Pelagibacteraceae bacterium]|nr:glycosyltransferase family 2 protein [Pelagibacteraceae bacterium]
MQIKFSIILPCYNEYGNLKLLIPEILNIFKNKSFEILVIDDNSSDQTIAKLKNHFSKNSRIKYILRRKNRSLGLSIKAGVMASKGKAVVVMDTDFNHKPIDLKKMLHLYETNSFDMICGSRFLKGGFSSTTFRHFTSLIFNYFINFIIKGKQTDNLSGFFIIKRNLISKILNKIFYGYGDYYIRLLFYLQRTEISIKEIPVKYGVRKYGVSKSRLARMFLLYTIETFKLLK